MGLLQLATKNRIVLVRFSSMRFQVADALRSFLGNPRILKTGVGVIDDCDKMRKDLKISSIKGVVDIDAIYNDFVGGIMGHCNGLARLYREVCGECMRFKDKSICLSEWNSPLPLSEPQIAYAADDALAGYRIFMTLMESLNDGFIEEKDVIEKKFCSEFVDKPKKRHKPQYRGRKMSRHKKKSKRRRR